MAFTRTATVTKTFSRIDLLKMQVTIALRRTRVAKTTISKIQMGMDRRWIEKIIIYGVDGTGKAWCGLTIRIDWARHQLHMAAGRTTVAIDERWEDDTAVELDETLRLFEDFVATRDLQPLIHVWYPSGLNHSQIRQDLGFVTANSVSWAGHHHGVTVGIPEIDEMTIGFDMVPPG